MGSIDFGSDLDFGPQTSRVFPMMISILVNGESQAVAAEATVSDLLKQLKMNPKFLAVELNRHVVPRGQHDQVTLNANDQLEIVTLVGGG
jgi:sulfur carrier protein